MTHPPDDGDPEFDRILQAFGVMQTWLCKQDVSNHPGWFHAWDFSQELFRQFAVAECIGDCRFVEIRQACIPEEAEVLTQLAHALEAKKARAFVAHR